MYRFLFLLSTMLLMGCTIEDEKDILEEIIDEPPVISVMSLGGQSTADSEYAQAKFKIVADRESKVDMLVWMEIIELTPSGSRWANSCNHYDDDDIVRIPKGEKESEPVEIDSRSGTRSGVIAVRVVAFPLEDIVDAGIVIDQEAFQFRWSGKTTNDGKKIPENHIFAYYEIAEVNPLVIYTANSEFESCRPREGWVFPKR